MPNKNLQYKKTNKTTNTKLSKKKTNGILPFVTMWMDLKGIRLSEVSQTEKDKYLIISFIVESKNKPKKMNKKSRTRFIGTEKNMAAREERVGDVQNAERRLRGAHQLQINK